MVNQKLLAVRKEIKSSKPDFARQDSNNHPQFRESWRRPRGIHNKMKKCIRGNKYMPAVGYGGPKDTRGLTSSGLMTVLVSNLKDFERCSDDCAAVISSGVGMKKRLYLLNFALGKKIRVMGVKDIAADVSRIESVFADRKKSRLTKEKKIEEKKKEMETKANAEETKKDAKNLGIKDGRVQEVKKENESEK